MFEEAFTVSPEEAGEFLVSLGEELQEGDELTVTGDGWKIPFEFGETVSIEIEYDGNEPELEFEVELEGRMEEDEVPEISWVGFERRSGRELLHVEFERREVENARITHIGLYVHRFLVRRL